MKRSNKKIEVKLADCHLHRTLDRFVYASVHEVNMIRKRGEYFGDKYDLFESPSSLARTQERAEPQSEGTEAQEPKKEERSNGNEQRGRVCVL